ncbi:beta-glucoside-specific PTS transporter subunit IIABC [Paenibacillus sp. Leaf72]|uniref:beta-glucoside-specific PTS transporter subunit IIABC n=1 Tax=Paenibacillus sp. Leaf72 TaxID=1736234 RepID=UPI0006FDEB14|nr:beta-glucoside-specific PTS transporter subunit IIABC [Paenibacillus sp. Leaf72]KQO12703.1 PTS sugar transporter subunit IIBC [Paenibacillus sp. Leaf72]
MNYKETAKSILDKVGGESNISSVIHCSTRLRMTLKTPAKAQTEAIKQLDGVLDVVNSSGQYQIIIGNDVGYVYRELAQMTTIDAESGSVKREKGFKAGFNLFAGTISGIIQPVIPAIAAAGMLKALLVLVTSLGWLAKENQVYVILSIVGDAAFYFLPILLAFTSAQKFKVNPYVAVSIAGVLLHPNLTALFNSKVPIAFLGMPIPVVQYASTVIPIILIVWFMSYIERFADKVSPGPVKIFLKPLIVLLIVVPVGLIVIGPLGTYVGNGLSTGVYWIQDRAGWLTVALMAIILPFIVMFGMHKVFYPVVFTSLASPGYDTLLLVAMLSYNIAQGSGALAVAFKTKDAKLKSLAISAGISGLFGITEPALYGVHLRLKKTMIGCMIGAGIAGAYSGIVQLKAYAAVGPGLASLPMYISSDSSANIINAIVTLIISAVITFLAVYFIGFQDTAQSAAAGNGTVVPPASSTTLTQQAGASEQAKQTPQTIKSNAKSYIYSPLEGTSVALRNIKDEAFSKELMGKGMAVRPSAGRVVAPFDGTLETLTRSKHALGLKSASGVELLIHIGLDTVKLKGQHFTAHAAAGDVIKQGQLLVEFDLEAIKQAGYDTTTPVIVTNTADYLEIVTQDENSPAGPDTRLVTVI